MPDYWPLSVTHYISPLSPRRAFGPSERTNPKHSSNRHLSEFVSKAWRPWNPKGKTPKWWTDELQQKKEEEEDEEEDEEEEDEEYDNEGQQETYTQLPPIGKCVF